MAVAPALSEATTPLSGRHTYPDRRHTRPTEMLKTRAIRTPVRRSCAPHDSYDHARLEDRTVAHRVIQSRCITQWPVSR